MQDTDDTNDIGNDFEPLRLIFVGIALLLGLLIGLG